jgi:hypothetical protein
VAASKDAPSVSSTVTRAAIASVPYAGGFEVIYQDWRARQAAKAEQTIGDILAMTGEHELRDRLGSVAEVEAVFVEGVQAALKTGIEAKRRLLAKAVANAVIDDALIDGSWLIADVLSQLDVPHIRALDALMREWERGAEPDNRMGRSVVWQSLLDPIKATLVRTGTATPSPQMFTAGVTHFVDGITVFGRELIRQLREEGYGADNPA